MCSQDPRRNGTKYNLNDLPSSCRRKLWARQTDYCENYEECNDGVILREARGLSDGDDDGYSFEDQYLDGIPISGHSFERSSQLLRRGGSIDRGRHYGVSFSKFGKVAFSHHTARYVSPAHVKQVTASPQVDPSNQ